LAEFEMLPEWAGRKAATSPQAVQADETAPLPAVGPLETIPEPVEATVDETAEVQVFKAEVDPDMEPADLQVAVAPGGFAQAEVAASGPAEHRSTMNLLVLAMLALAAGIAAGYLYVLAS
jgi:hypothetical protein